MTQIHAPRTASGKITARIWEFDAGSDDPRAIQGGGGASETLIKTFRHSEWLICRWVAIYRSYGDHLRMERMA